MHRYIVGELVWMNDETTATVLEVSEDFMVVRVRPMWTSYHPDPEDITLVASAIKPVLNMHAHLTSDSVDCDGPIQRGWTDMPGDAERCSPFGEYEFKRRVLGDMISTYGFGALRVTPNGASWYETTDEGYRYQEVEWCAEDDCDRTTWQRDRRAEAEGY